MLKRFLKAWKADDVVRIILCTGATPDFMKIATIVRTYETNISEITKIQEK